jgi:hypothetical protein
MKRKPVTIGGVTYPSQSAAMEALHIDLRQRGAVKRRPVVIDGIWYRSQADAARALGVSRQAINQRPDPREGYDIDF